MADSSPANGNVHRRFYEATFSLGNVINLVAMLGAAFMVVMTLKGDIGEVKTDVAVIKQRVKTVEQAVGLGRTREP
mgnify:CR=1 FL=1